MKLCSNGIYRGIIFHLILWVAYIGYEILLMIFIYHVNIPVSNYIFFYTCNIGLFYWHFYTLNRYLSQTPPGYILLSLVILLELIVVMAVKGSWDYASISNRVPLQQIWTELKTVLALDLSRSILFMFFSTVLWAAINFGRSRRRIEEALLKSALADKANSDLKYQFAQAQNAFLKQQINPHLLFNTLNAIYNTVYLNSPEDSRSVLLLSEIMRYSFEEPDLHGCVSLKVELEQLQNLINLNSYRFDKTVQLEFKISGDPSPHRIIPLVLITLTENMFKHGDLRLEPRSLRISVDADGHLSFLSKNVTKRSGSPEPGTHVGLSNTRLRLDYAYPDNYNLTVSQTDDLFTLELNINLAYERSNY